MITTFALIALVRFAISLPDNYGFQSYIVHITEPSVKFMFYKPPAYPKHKFEYAVKNTQTDDIKQSEERHGISVKGEYSFFEPDGTIRKVQYHDDGDSGFNAIVTRLGNAVHPPTKLAIPVALETSGYLH